MKIWILVRVWCGVISEVKIFKDEEEAINAYAAMRKKFNEEKEEIELFEREV